MSSESSPLTPNDVDSDIEFSMFSLSDDLDLDFGFGGISKTTVNNEPERSETVIMGRKPNSLLVLASKAIAAQFPFEVVETSSLAVPEELQRLIAFHSFPTDEDDIWLYSCLNSGGSYEFDQGEALWADKAVKECVQIGFHLSATVLTSLHLTSGNGAHAGDGNPGSGDSSNPTTGPPDPFHVSFNNPIINGPSAPDATSNRAGNRTTDIPHESNGPNRRSGFHIEPCYPAHRVSLTFDRGRITACSCTCSFDPDDGCANLTPLRPGYADNEGVGPAALSFDLPSRFPLATSNNNNAVSQSGGFSYQPMLSDVIGPRNPSLPTGQSSQPTNQNEAARRQVLLRFGPESSRYGLPTRTYATGTVSHSRTVTESGGLMASTTNNNTAVDSPPLGETAGFIECSPPAGTWCSHVVATCLMRIRQPGRVMLRAPISESLSKLSKEELQKFAQNLICHVGPKKILPAAQRILDQLLASTDNPMKSSIGAPDPTAGGALGDVAAWCFDGSLLEEKLRVTLDRFWASKPNVIYSDIGSLNSNSPPDVDSFHCVLRSLRGNDPRGVWDLLSIIGDMMRRQDNNGVLLLEIVTRCVIDMQELMYWWYSVQLNPCILPRGLQMCQKQTQYAALWLCEEIVHLWRLACLNPDLRPSPPPATGDMTSAVRTPSGSSCTSLGSRDVMTATPQGYSPASPAPSQSTNGASTCWLLQQLTRRLRAFHTFALEQVRLRVTRTGAEDRTAPSTSSVPAAQTSTAYGLSSNGQSHAANFGRFRGFKSALAVCCLNWPTELPPTHCLSIAEFRACMPTFVGARVTEPTELTDFTDTPATIAYLDWMRSVKPLTRIDYELEPTSLYPMATGSSPDAEQFLFGDLPKPKDEVEFAFARFQALDSHGHSKRALIWARYLACRLLYLSSSFMSDCEAVAFDIVSGWRRPMEHEPADGRGMDATTGEAIPGSRGRKIGPCSSHGTDTGPAGVSEELSHRAVEWATKVSLLLDQIRSLMECLTRAYSESVTPGRSISSTSANRISSNGRTLLTYRGPDPALGNLHLDDTASPMIEQTSLDDPGRPISDDWLCVDIELAFRLGFYALWLPRPPTPSATLEVRLFDQQVGLVSRMCRLPIHVACPHVLQDIRHEGSMLAQNLSAYQSDIHIPYNLAAYIFHQLIGTRTTADVLASLTDPSILLQSNGSSNAGGAPSGTQSFTTGSRRRPPDEVNPSDRGLLGESEATALPPVGVSFSADASASSGHRRCHVLGTGVILSGSGLPLAMQIHLARKTGSSVLRGAGGSGNSRLVRELDRIACASLQNELLSDAELGFASVWSVLGTRSRVPQTVYPYFAEAQWEQLDALVVYLFRYYRDDISKLDRLLYHLLDRFHNPHFKAPPLWACLTLPVRDLLAYDSSTAQGQQTLSRAEHNCPSVVNESTNSRVYDDEVVGAQEMPGEQLTLDENAIASSSVTSIPPESTNIEMNNEWTLSQAASEGSSTNDDSQAEQINILNEDASGETQMADVGLDCRPKTDPAEEDAPCMPGTSSQLEPGQPVSEQVAVHAVPAGSGREHTTHDPASASEDTDTLSDSKLWIDAFRCATLRDPRRRGRHSIGMAAVDTSAPETTSSDNSPLTARRLRNLHQRTLSSASVNESSDNGGTDPMETTATTTNSSQAQSPKPTSANALLTSTTSSIQQHRVRVARSDARQDSSVVRTRVRPRTTTTRSSPHAAVSSSSDDEDDDRVPSRLDIPSLVVGEEAAIGTTRTEMTSYADNVSLQNTQSAPIGNIPEENSVPVTTSKINNRLVNRSTWPAHLTRPQAQPLSDSIAFHAFHLAKLVRTLAGGSSASVSVFLAEPEATGVVHRNLQLVAFQIGLYSLGLHNDLMHSWQSRTYSRIGGWVSQQVFEIGLPAACILYHSWQQHFTAAELANIAFQLSRENNRVLVDIAAELCLASLASCTTLRPPDIYRALGQCEEHSTAAVERGLVKIESGDTQTSYGLLPEIHFFLARSWFSLHQTTVEECKKATESLQQHLKQQQQQEQQTRQHHQHSKSPVGVTTIEQQQQPSHMPPTIVATRPVATSAPYAGTPISFTMASSWPVQLPTYNPFLAVSGPTYNNPIYYSAPPVPSSSDPNVPLHPPLYYDPSTQSAPMFPAMVAHYGPPPPPSRATVPIDHTGRFVIPNYHQQPVMFAGQHSLQGRTSTAPNYPYPPMAQPGGGGGRLLPGPQQLPPMMQQQPPPAFLSQSTMGYNTSAQFFNHPFVSQQSFAVMPQSVQPPVATISNAPIAQSIDFATHSTTTQPGSPVTNTSVYLVNQPNCIPTAPTHPSSEGVSNISQQPDRLNSATSPASTLNIHRPSAVWSNASGSVVVHPASSDHASTISETDSSRPTESVVEGLLDETTTTSVPTTESTTTLSLLGQSVGAQAGASTGQDGTYSSSVASTIPVLEAKSLMYLRRAYLAAVCAIKKIFFPQSSTHASTYNFPTISTQSGAVTRSGRGGKHFHHHHHHLHHSHLQRQVRQQYQQRDPNALLIPPQPPGGSIHLDFESSMGGSSGGGGAGAAAQVSVGGASIMPSSQSDLSGGSRLRSSMSADAQMAKVWDANILWTLDVASALGPPVVHEYCNLVLQCVQYPLLMKQITSKVIEYFKNLPPTSSTQQLPSSPMNQDALRNASDPYFCPPAPPLPKPMETPVQYYQPTTHYPFIPTMSNWPTSPPSTTVASCTAVTPTTVPPAGTALLVPSSYSTMPPASMPPPPIWFLSPNGYPTAPTGAIPFLAPGHQDLTGRPIQTAGLLVDGNNRAQLTNPPVSFIPSSQPTPAASCWTRPMHLTPVPSATTLTTNQTNQYGLEEKPQQQQLVQSAGGRELIERLINRTHALFHKFIDQRLQYISSGQTEWDEFVDLILRAYNVHLAMPATDCGLHWNNLLTRVRRHHKCSAALWQRILAGIQTVDLKRSG